MPDYSDLDPSLLKPSLSDGTKLKKSITTDLYSTGTPSAANQVKRSIMYADGTLKESIANDTALKPSWLLYGEAPVAGATMSIAILEDQQTSGTDGGAFTSGARRTRVLNTEVYDPDGIVTLSSNQFTLQAGTYEIEATSEAYSTNLSKVWIHNVTDASDIVGDSAFASADYASRAIAGGVVTIASAKVFELQQQCQTTSATFGLGVAGSFDTEVFSQVTIKKVA